MELYFEIMNILDENDKFKKALWFLDELITLLELRLEKKDSPIIWRIKIHFDPHRINRHKSVMDIIVIDDARQFNGGKFLEKYILRCKK